MADDGTFSEGVGESGEDERLRSEALANQLGVYGKSAVKLSQGRGKKKTKKADGGVTVDRQRAKEKKEERKGALDMDREARKALQEKKKVSSADRDAEKRRQSRLLKLKQLQASLQDSDDEDEEDTSLLARLRGARRSGRGAKKSRVAADGDVDDEPLTIAVWVYLIFSFVALDRGIKFVSTYGDPVLVSKALGGVLILASFGVKVPQILAIQEAKTVKGLSELQMYSGIIALTLAVVYHAFNRHAFTAWGDALSMLGQDMMIVGLMWTYGKTKTPAKVGLVIAYVVFAGALVGMAASTRPDKLVALPVAANIIGQAGKLPQIVANARNKHTGPASFITQLMLFLGAVARVFTTMTEMNDPVTLAGFLSSVTLQGILLAQMLAFWANTKHVLAKAKLKEAAKRKEE